MSTLYPDPYHDPNTIVVKTPNWTPGEPDLENFLIRYDWENASNGISPYKDKILDKFPYFNNRQYETIDIYIQYKICYPVPLDWNSTDFPTMDDYWLDKIFNKYVANVERIKLVGFEKYYNPVSNHIEYKLEDGTYVETEEVVKPLKHYTKKVDTLGMLEDTKFIQDCMPQANRNRKIDELLADDE